MLKSNDIKPSPYEVAPSKPLIVIHSSSHLGPHRGVKGKVEAELQGEVKVVVKARGGRTWDEVLIKDFEEINEANKGRKILHIVILGDNDVRRAQKFRETMPFLVKFGKTVAEALSSRENIEIFVNGLIPFPVNEHPNSSDLRHKYHKYTRRMSGLVNLSHKIHYVPMKEPFDNFCRGKEVTASEMFLRDRVHLSGFGEAFLADFIVMQARLFKNSRPNAPLMQNLVSSRQPVLENFRKLMKEFDV